MNVDTLFASLFSLLAVVMAVYLYVLFHNAFRHRGAREIREDARNTICQSIVSGRVLLIFIAVAVGVVYGIAAMDFARFAVVVAVNVSIVALSQIGFAVARSRF